jgi:macrolide-specific efflux system membrane fusion protein
MNKKSKYIVSGVLLLLVLALAGSGWYYFSAKAGSKSTYKEVPVQIGDLEVFVQSTGQVQPENRLVVRPSISGRIEDVLIDEGKQVKSGQILAWMSSSDRAALLDMASAKSSDEVQHWKDIYKPSPIIAPLSGFVIAKNVEPGQVVTTSDTAFVISNRLIISAQVDETDLARVKLNQPVTVTLDAFNDRPIAGKVARIAYEARTANNVTVYDIRVVTDTAPDFMRSGMTASVKFIEATKSQVVKVPISLFTKDRSARELRKPGTELNVLVKTGGTEKKPTYDEKKVILGMSDGRTVEIVEGLKGTETLLEESLPEDKKPSNPFSPFGNKPRKK